MGEIIIVLVDYCLSLRSYSSLLNYRFYLRESVEQVELFVSTREQTVVRAGDDLADACFFEVGESLASCANQVEVEELGQQLLAVESIQDKAFCVLLHVGECGALRPQDLVCGQHRGLRNHS